MTDLNTNQYLTKQPYLQNQPTYGDGKGGFPTSIDDKRLDPIKDKTKNNFVVSTAKTMIGEPVNIAIGTIPFLAIDRLLKWLPNGKDFESSFLGKKIIGNIDKLPKFNWLKEAYDKLPETNFIKQLINAPSATPRFSLAKGQVTPSRTTILTQMLDEAVEISGKDSKAVAGIKTALETATKGNSYEKTCEKAFSTAHELAGKNLSKRFLNLSNRAQFFTKNHSGISKVVMSIYNNMTTFLTANVGKFKSGMGIKSLGANAVKLGGAAFMFCMGANILGEIIKDTWKTPKGEKISTFAHGTIAKLGSWIMMIPLGMFLFKGIGSLKNLTVPKEGNLLSKIIKAPFRGLGTLFSTGLKTEKGGVLKTISNGFKRVGGGFGRLALFAFALTPLTDKALRFVSHSIFGKPHMLLAKEKAEEALNSDINKTNGSKGTWEKRAKQEQDVIKSKYESHFHTLNKLESSKDKNKYELIKNENQRFDEETSVLWPKEEVDTEALRKALEQNKARMLTVSAKNQQTSFGNTSPFVAQQLKSRSENLNKTSVTNSITDAPLKDSAIKPDLTQEINPKQQYMPSDTRKSQQENIEKKAKFDAVLAKTDSVLADAQKALGS